ncbi:hypothetical protein N7495_001385 [Penicillium taxi]|uniref:uncharacterized protein n=1 Tax=Penicillium taxi TaxID=168475 RepID=UPI002545476B|nr:uncharacterized protein N7495_001385 [Penicillium taxi]KAJ5908703.1 hypothetical protein N7495_001385 [Penicillium taxi]
MSSSHDNTGLQYYDLQNFTFQNGVTLPNVRIAYRDFNPTSQKTAVIHTCFLGRINNTLNFKTGVLKTYRVIVIALFGNGESSSPSTQTDFPSVLDYQDCVKAQYKLITEHLKLLSLDVMLGFSMGGQCTYHWTAMYPEVVKNAVIICSSAKTSLHNRQFLEGPKAALENSVDYNSESWTVHKQPPLRGLHAFARAYSAWLTSAEWFEEQLFQKGGFNTLGEWSESRELMYDSWHPENLLVMARMWQRSDIGLSVPDRDGVRIDEALSSLKSRVLLMPCQTDQYFKWEASEKEASFLKYGQLAVIPSIWGHVAGGGGNPGDIEWMDRRIDEFLN